MSENPVSSWTVLNSELVLNTPYMRVRRDQVRLPSGEVIPDYYVWDSPEAVIIVALRSDGRIPVVRQYKHGVQAVVLEFPAGEVDSGEAPCDAARRELLEETGYSAPHWEQIATLVNHPSKESGRVHVFLASGAVESATPALAASEGIEVELMTLEEFAAAARAGEVCVAAMVAATWLLMAHRDSKVAVATT